MLNLSFLDSVPMALEKTLERAYHTTMGIGEIEYKNFHNEELS
jgi:hypothetical protein